MLGWYGVWRDIVCLGNIDLKKKGRYQETRSIWDVDMENDWKDKLDGALEKCGCSSSGWRGQIIDWYHQTKTKELDWSYITWGVAAKNCTRGKKKTRGRPRIMLDWMMDGEWKMDYSELKKKSSNRQNWHQWNPKPAWRHLMMMMCYVAVDEMIDNISLLTREEPPIRAMRPPDKMIGNMPLLTKEGPPMPIPQSSGSLAPEINN